jgi:hypothetical protein
MSAAPERGGGLRSIVALPMPGVQPAAVTKAPLVFKWVDPKSLFVEEAYQRGLSERSVKMIRRYVGGWDWRGFKPPIVMLDEQDRMVVLDGQHTAIAAASHGGLPQIPVMLVPTGTLQQRARAFIGHNTDRLAPTPMQLFFASIEAGDDVASAVTAGVAKGGGRVCRTPPPNGQWKPGDTIAIAALRKLAEAKGKAGVARVTRLLVEAGRAPLRGDEIKAVSWFFYDKLGKAYDEFDLATLVRSKTAAQWDRAAQDLRAREPMPVWRALIELWRRRLDRDAKAGA